MTMKTIISLRRITHVEYPTLLPPVMHLGTTYRANVSTTCAIVY